MPYLVFVYGTLKRGFPNHHYMADCRFLSEGRTVERFPLVVGGDWFSPYLLPEAGEGHCVNGEVWEVPEAVMPALDALESVHLPNGYRRREIAIERAGGDRICMAWTYFRERRHIKIIHTDALHDYQDRRYVAAADRD